MNLNAVRMFVDVAQTGSFSKSASKLDIPIATLSRNISELEKSLNCQLLIRHKTGVSTTVAGQRFYEQSLGGIEQLLIAERNLSDDEQNLSGQLRIATPPSFSPAWDVIAAFSRAYPNVAVHCTASGRLMDFFADGIDVAFRIGELHTDTVIAKKLFDSDTALVATPEFLAKWGAPTQLADLSRLPVATWSESGQVVYPYQQLFANGLPRLDFRFTSNSLEAVLYYVRQHLAVGLVPPYVVQEWLNRGELTELFANEVKSKHDVHLIYPAHRHQSAVLKAFVGFCVEWFGQAQ
ncbi:DNA-binding transcriptional LysR family regulator [Neisseria sp. HSC-16F19]|nr:LysR family transcriptional regulator [Neisseria sp. HSC-16F19]MCP2040761.1 DNA-binding transcriptional LysR family regulator [Neisseria sp. HSC-16F19]